MTPGNQRCEHEEDLFPFADHHAVDVVDQPRSDLLDSVCFDLLLSGAWLTHEEKVPLEPAGWCLRAKEQGRPNRALRTAIRLTNRPLGLVAGAQFLMFARRNFITPTTAAVL